MTSGPGYAYDNHGNKIWLLTLMDLKAIVAQNRVTGCHAAGLRSVHVSQICGSEGRSADFDRFFNPLCGHTRHRWIGVLLARWTDVPLAPVRLIQVGQTYFVRDGHHRVSVAHAHGEKWVGAAVEV
jgi:hypothetical protein